MTKYVALLPSNQDRNIYADGAHSEYQVLHQIAKEAERYGIGLQGVMAKAIPAVPESRDVWSLQGLYRQMGDAVNWLRSCGADPAETAMVNLHSDSGERRHVFGIYGGGRDSISYRLAATVAPRVEAVMQTGNLSYLDYSGYVFYLKRGPYNTCLIELGSHQNADDIDFLLHRQSDLAVAIVDGALEHLGVVPKPQQPMNALAQAMSYFSTHGIEAHPDHAIFKYWRTAFALGDVANLGPALSDEEDGGRYGEPDAVIQKFENGIVVSKKNEGWRCYRAQVVLEPERWFGDI